VAVDVDDGDSDGWAAVGDEAQAATRTTRKAVNPLARTA